MGSEEVVSKLKRECKIDIMEGQRARRMDRQDRESPSRGAAALRGGPTILPELTCEMLHDDLTPGEWFPLTFVPFVHLTVPPLCEPWAFPFPSIIERRQVYNSSLPQCRVHVLLSPNAKYVRVIKVFQNNYPVSSPQGRNCNITSSSLNLPRFQENPRTTNY